jgi:hypothetical protein
LLIVEALGGHIGLHHGTQATDIDSNLHCGRNAKEINGLHELRAIIRQNDIPEISLTQGLIIGLAGQLLRVKAERSRLSASFYGVKVTLPDSCTCSSWIFFKYSKAVTANTSRAMKVYTPAVLALPIGIIIVSKSNRQPVWLK